MRHKKNAAKSFEKGNNALAVPVKKQLWKKKFRKNFNQSHSWTKITHANVKFEKKINFKVNAL